RHITEVSFDDLTYGKRDPELHFPHLLQSPSDGLRIRRIEVARMIFKKFPGALGAVADENGGGVRDFPVATEAEPALPDHGLASEEDGPRGAGDHLSIKLAAHEFVALHEPLGDSDSYLLCCCGGHRNLSPQWPRIPARCSFWSRTNETNCAWLHPSVRRSYKSSSAM